MDAERFDAIIIGAGQPGGPLSTALGAAGWKTAIIERRHVGGTCVNYGCTPTKTMVASARIAHLSRRASDYGVTTGTVSVDLRAVRQRKQAMVESFRGGSQSAIEGSDNVELIFGEARFSEHKTVEVALPGGRVRSLAADVIVINAGGRPRIPDIPGLSDAGPLDSTSIMELDAVPERLVVIGGGAVGLEFSQMFRRFGSRVTVIERGERLLSQEDADVADAVAGILIEDGVDIVFSGSVDRIETNHSEKVVVITAGDEVRRIACDEILVAAGRIPNSDLLNLDATGVAIDERGYISVDDRLDTNVSGVYAVGDVNGGPAFTHIAYDDFRILSANLLEGANRSTEGRMLPYTIFIDPQLGRIGLTEAQVREQGLDVLVFKLPMSSVARALEVGETRGLMKAVVDRASGRILGASMLGIEGGEIAGAIQVAMLGELPYTSLQNAVFAHPTLMESLNNLFGSPVDA